MSRLNFAPSNLSMNKVYKIVAATGISPIMPLVLNISENTVEVTIIPPLAVLFSLSFEQRIFRKIEIKLIIAPDGEPRIMQTNPLNVICTDWSRRAIFFDHIKPLAVVSEQAKNEIMFPISTAFDNDEIILTSLEFLHLFVSAYIFYVVGRENINI